MTDRLDPHASVAHLFFMNRPPPCSPLFPYTTLFRSLPQPFDGSPTQQRTQVMITALTHGPHIGNGAPVRIQTQDKDRKSTRLNSSHRTISYAVFCLKKTIEFQPRAQADEITDYSL